jgi:hypothetical protein
LPLKQTAEVMDCIIGLAELAGAMLALSYGAETLICRR